MSSDRRRDKHDLVMSLSLVSQARTREQSYALPPWSPFGGVFRFCPIEITNPSQDLLSLRAEIRNNELEEFLGTVFSLQSTRKSDMEYPLILETSLG